MILRLKPRESRPPPDLQTADMHQTELHPDQHTINSRPNQCSTNLPEHTTSENNPAKRREQKFNAGWSSPVARQAHNLKVTGSNPVPAPNFPKIYIPFRAFPDACTFACANDKLIP
jgi:hypothetical protein